MNTQRIIILDGAAHNAFFNREGDLYPNGIPVYFGFFKSLIMRNCFVLAINARDEARFNALIIKSLKVEMRLQRRHLRVGAFSQPERSHIRRRLVFPLVQIGEAKIGPDCNKNANSAQKERCQDEGCSPVSREYSRNGLMWSVPRYSDAR